MKSFWLTISIFLGFVTLVQAQFPGCPNISTGPDQTLVCSQPCTNLTASVFHAGATTSYTVSSVPHNPPIAYNAAGGTAVSVGTDDVWSPIITLPFPFCFYGQTYTTCKIGSNGAIQFGPTTAGGYHPWEFSVNCPDPYLIPAGNVFGPYHDIDPSLGGTVRWYLLGTAPCRIFVVSYNQIPHYSCDGFLFNPLRRSTFMMVLYETTNVIDVYVNLKETCTGWNGGRAVIGIQDNTGNVGLAAPGRNSNPNWAVATSNPEGWRFTPSGAPIYGAITWLENGNPIGTGNTIQVCPAQTTTYVATVQYTRCDGFVIFELDSVTVTVNNTATATASSNSPICEGATLNLFGSGGVSYSWSGPGGYTSSSQNPSILNASFTNQGTYFVTVTDANGCVATDSVDVTIWATTSVSATSNSPICADDTLKFLAIGGDTYQWTGPGFSSNQADPFIFPATAANSGTYSVIITNQCFSDTITLSVTVYNNPNVTANSNSPLCINGDLQLTATGGVNYAWTGPNGFTSTDQNPLITGVTLNDAGVYTVVVTDGNGCVDSATVTVQVVTSAPGTASSNSPVCVGDDILLSASGGNIYSWTGPNGFSSALSNPTITNASTSNSGVYTVIVTDNLGCTDTVSISVVVSLPPSPTASNNSPVCPGDTLFLQATGGDVYNWSGPGGFSSNDPSPFIYPATAAAAGQYTVQVADSGGCSESATTDVTLHAVSVTASSNSPLCVNATLNLFSSNGISHSWAGPNGFSSNDQNPILPFVTLNEAGIYQVVVTDSNGCSDSAFVNVVVDSLLNGIATSNSPVCEGDVIQLNALGGTDFIWSGPDNFSSNLQSPSILNSTVAMAGTYTVFISDTFGCADTVTVEVIIALPPVVSVSSNSPVCPWDTIFLNASGGDVYSWSGPGGFSSNSPTPFIANASAANAGTYTVTVSDSIGCSASGSVQVSLITVQATAGSNSPLCIGSTLNLTASGGVSYSWSGPAGFSSADQNPSIPNVDLSNSGAYTVIVTDANGCSDTTTIQVTVTTGITGSASSNSPLCHGDDLQLNASGGVIFSWTGPAGFTSASQNPVVANVDASNSGTYSVIITDANGCSDTVSIQVLVYAQIEPAITVAAPVCLGESLELCSGTWATYQWFDGSSGQCTGVTEPGVYGLTVSDSNGCSGDVSTQVDQSSFIVLSVSAQAEPALINFGETSVLSTNLSGAYTYSWEPTTGLNDPTSATPQASPEETTFYLVTVTDSNGCTASDSVLVEVETINKYVIPSAFTPNNDGQNDFFEVLIRGDITVVDCIIYNRWGQEVYNSAQAKWDGKFKSADQPVGTYIYMITIRLKDGTLIKETDAFSLIR